MTTRSNILMTNGVRKLWVAVAVMAIHSSCVKIKLYNNAVETDIINTVEPPL